MSIRATLMSELLVSMGGINSDPGTDATDWNGVRGTLRRSFTKSELPLMIVIDNASSTDTRARSNAHTKLVQFSIHLLAALGDGTLDYLRNGIDDVLRALGKLEAGWIDSYRCDPFDEMSDEILDIEEGAVYAEAVIRFTVGYRVKKFEQ